MPWRRVPEREECGMRMRMRRGHYSALAALAFALALTPGLSDGAAQSLRAARRGAAEARELTYDEAICARRDDGAGVRTVVGEALAASITRTGEGRAPADAPEEVRLIPGGQSVGIAIDTAGVIVVGASDLGSTPSPAREAGIRSGDIIKGVNGRAVDGAEALSALVSGSTPIAVDVLRGNEKMTCEVRPAQDARDGQWRLGVWVRDSTAGVGTLTFIDPSTGLYGALGHAISDSDTGVAMPVRAGELYENNVVDVTPSRRGRPGELTGDFVFNTVTAGTVEINSEKGIFGHTTLEGGNARYPEGLIAAKRSEIHPGPAALLTTLDASGPREYACEVVRCPRSDGRMVIRATDPGLLERTGGIVQGMSGSPILQDGRLIGAVTHVMVNDPARGYGVSIEEMLEAARAIEGDGNQGLAA